MTSKPSICGCACSATWPRRARGLEPKRGLAGREAALSEASAAAQAVAHGIAGTWDFKWRQGSKIQVVFQELSGATLQQLPSTLRRDPDQLAAWEQRVRKQVRDYAEQWTRGTSVEFDFTTLWGRPFPPPHHHGRSPCAHERLERRYDVLVSLEPLPVEEPATTTDPVRVISAPTSQLGTYARRVDYGVPTMYLGRPQGDETPLEEYFGSPSFAAIATHEFGHAIGLAHEHQNPKAGLKWKPWNEIRAIIQKFWKLEDGHPFLSREYIETEITSSWPGNPRFSDWRTVGLKPVAGSPPSAGAGPQPIAAGLVIELDSVMAHGLYKAFLKDVPAEPFLEEALAAPPRIEPTLGDRAHVQRMYPPGPQARRGKHSGAQGAAPSPETPLEGSGEREQIPEPAQ